MSGERKTRGTSVSELLEYKISYDGNGALQWHPPVGSKELAIALSYHFPEEKDMEEKMRAAIKGFLRDQQKIISNVLGDEVENKSRQSVETGNQHAVAERQKASNHSDLQVLYWDPLGETFKGNQGRTKRRYGKIEGAKVSANRGNVCDYHRKNKSKCDPDLCPNNKLRLQNFAKSRENIAEPIIPPNDVSSEKDLQGIFRSSMSNSSNAARHISQYSEDGAAYFSQNCAELVMKPDLAIPNNGFSEWNPDSSTIRAGETNQQPTVTTWATELDFTLPGMIAKDLEHSTKTDTSPTGLFSRQELFIQSHETHIADLIRANNDLEQEIAALETSWLDISESHTPSLGIGLSDRALSSFSIVIAIAAAVLSPHRAVTTNLHQMAEIREKLSNARSTFEKGRAELETANKELEYLKAARDLEADLPSLQREVDRELDLAFQRISL